MFNQLTKFGAGDSSSGISSLGINLKSFIFQLITFLIVLAILRKWVFPKLVATLEARRKTLEDSLVQAKLTQEALEKAEQKAEVLLGQAREQADAALAGAEAQAKQIIAEAEAKGEEAAERIKAEAQTFLQQQGERLRQELKAELVALVAQATAKVIEQKLMPEEDMKLIKDAIKVVGK